MLTYQIIRSKAAWRYSEKGSPACVVLAAQITHSDKTREQFIADYVLGFLLIYPDLAVITSRIGSREGAMAGVLRQVRGQPRVSTKAHDCLRASLVNAVFYLGGKAGDAYMQGYTPTMVSGPGLMRWPYFLNALNR